MIGKSVCFRIVICFLYVIAISSTLSQTSVRRGRNRRSDLDTRFMDIVRSAFNSLATDRGLKANNKFHRAIDEIERALASTQAGRGSRTFNPKEAKEFMKILARTAESGNIENFRQILGRAIFHNMTGITSKYLQQQTNTVINEDTIALLEGAKAFLNDIERQIGKEHFEELISFRGEVTLVFVIDSTGSMKEDIEAAKAIAKEIVLQDREFPVNFILSTFSDPDVAPVVYHDENNVIKAITSIGNITVDGGGDCPEMAFEGLLQALYNSPMPGSAMYVFTDAFAKDDTRENIDTVTALAIDLGVSVYFFTSGDCGGHKSKMSSFKTVAQATGGLMFPLHSSKEIRKLSGFVKQNLQGGATVDSNTVNEASTKSYTIVVDDTIKTLVLTVIMSKMNTNVRLISPDGVEQNATNRLDLNVIFNLENPTPGNWTLQVPSSAGDIEYLVRTISKLNIDFSYYYFKYNPKMASRSHVPVVHPLLGEDALVMITIYEMQHVDNTSLNLNVIYKNGTNGGAFKMHPVGSSGFRFFATIRLDKGPYKLQLVGRTKTGHMFIRLSPVFDEAKPFRLRVIYAKKYTLPVGRESKLNLVIENPSAEGYEFDVKDSFGYARDVTSRVSYRRHMSQQNFHLRFSVPANATANIDKTNRVVINAIGITTRVTSTEICHLLIIPKEDSI
ncbi:hemicentin-1-like [Dendronephthya gigantea]|uniref:hemicentin-1-like n=1 Tax=Dendronephthya gigantea TaxID=151771 RepID=UPI00106DACFB|nr:hemicentin-1-like [Dendronephthya gigantea]